METEIIKLYLEKLEQMTNRERAVLIESIAWINYPIFTTSGESGTLKIYPPKPIE